MSWLGLSTSINLCVSSSKKRGVLPWKALVFMKIIKRLKKGSNLLQYTCLEDAKIWDCVCLIHLFISCWLITVAHSLSGGGAAPLLSTSASLKHWLFPHLIAVRKKLWHLNRYSCHGSNCVKWFQVDRKSWMVKMAAASVMVLLLQPLRMRLNSGFKLFLEVVN